MESASILAVVGCRTSHHASHLAKFGQCRRARRRRPYCPRACEDAASPPRGGAASRQRLRRQEEEEARLADASRTGRGGQTRDADTCGANTCSAGQRDGARPVLPQRPDRRLRVRELRQILQGGQGRESLRGASQRLSPASRRAQRLSVSALPPAARSSASATRAASARRTTRPTRRASRSTPSPPRRRWAAARRRRSSAAAPGCGARCAARRREERKRRRHRTSEANRALVGKRW